MAAVGSDLESVELTTRELWLDGPPHELFKQMRAECPIHWTEGFEEFPDEAGFWSVTTAEDIHTVSRDWRTYSSERGRDHGGRCASRSSSHGRCSSAWTRPSTTA